uniref:ATP synthase complex subunit 8 n=1 Tax=Gegeneophis ramaswamii TaxID=194526 RepID=Q64JU3_GEGRA|nr:ATP synthase F0 subunit 8 [Gegeneophis ramaswamii]AAS13696.1 ATP synthase F0 subunit 8 [Gegeneophis ramaswamii]
MPQLNPNPWFLIMMMSWFILMTFFMNKTIKHTPSTFSFKQLQQKQLNKWYWPW